MPRILKSFLIPNPITCLPRKLYSSSGFIYKYISIYINTTSFLFIVLLLIINNYPSYNVICHSRMESLFVNSCQMSVEATNVILLNYCPKYEIPILVHNSYSNRDLGVRVQLYHIFNIKINVVTFFYNISFINKMDLDKL